MKERGQGGSELGIEESGRMIPQWRDFANYLRENWGVKELATSKNR
jgi:hypothetical protein